MSGRELRVLSQGGGGDFIVSEKQWEVIDNLIRGAHTTRNAQRAKELALAADTVLLKGELQPAAGALVIKDRRWIGRFADALGQSEFSSGWDHVFGIGWKTAYFYHDGKQVLSVGLIEGGDYRLRVYSSKGGGDYFVGEKQWEVVEELIRERMVANHAPDRMPGAGATGISGGH